MRLPPEFRRQLAEQALKILREDVEEATITLEDGGLDTIPHREIVRAVNCVNAAEICGIPKGQLLLDGSRSRQETEGPTLKVKQRLTLDFKYAHFPWNRFLAGKFGRYLWPEGTEPSIYEGFDFNELFEE